MIDDDLVKMSVLVTIKYVKAILFKISRLDDRWDCCTQYFGDVT